MTLDIIDVVAILAGFVSLFALVVSYKALIQAMEARADAVGVQRSTHTVVPGVTLDKKLAMAREELGKGVDKLLNPSKESFDWLDGINDQDEDEEKDTKREKVNG